MPLPIPALIALMMGSQAATSVGGGIAANNQRKSQEQLSRESLALDREQGLMDTAARESELDPFRHQLDQAGALSKLDRLERASYSPVSVNLPDRYAQYKPTISGGYSYERSPEVKAAAGALKQNVLAGRTAPSMTSAENYGKTATLDLTGNADPRTDAAFSMGAPNRDSLGAPAAPAMAPLTALSKGKTAAKNKRAQEIAAFEAANPGWTIDETGRVSRIARV